MMKKLRPTVSLSVRILVEEKVLLERLASVRGESLQSVIRLSIRKLATQSGLLKLAARKTQRGGEFSPTEKTKIRAEVFRRIKEQHPSWSYHRVALMGSEILGEYVTSESVRNAYRAMGWAWPRGDRVRR